MASVSRRQLLGLGIVGAAGYASAGTPAVLRSFHLDHILGTSLDVWAECDDIDAVEARVLAEIERLRRVFSTRDPDSELSRLNRADGPFRASSDLLAVLRLYEKWGRASGGACSPALGELARLWKQAQASGVEPTRLPVAATPAFRIDGDAVTRFPGRTLDLNSIAKGHILDRAKAVAGVERLLVNLGGDMASVGSWTVGVQDPSCPADNAAPLMTMALDSSVATSGGYLRGYAVGGTRHSHLIDPRTGRPASHVASATVVARDSATANALATMLCVLRPEEGLRLVAGIAECLIVTATGAMVRSAGFVADEKPKEPATAWPAGNTVSIALELPKPTTGRKIRRPYVAVWFETPDGKVVRSLAVWGTKPRWLPTLTGWWKAGKGGGALVRAVTRATRAPGKYSLAWDGKDDAGKGVPAGTYVVKIEVHREHGKHVFQTGKIECGAEPATLKLEANAETGETVVEYGKKK